jgi:hypothetical protein
MATTFLTGVVARVRPEIPALFDREWSRLARPGSQSTGAARVAIAAAGRAERYGDERGGLELPEPAEEAARTIAARPSQPSQAWVDRITAAIGEAAYVELVGVASRMAAVDTVHVALGAERPALPGPVPGEPTGERDDRARRNRAWVPMVGGASIVSALSLVPAESTAQEDMHGPLYLTYEGMSQPDYVRGLTRAQMELVAARTSTINECFY